MIDRHIIFLHLAFGMFIIERIYSLPYGRHSLDKGRKTDIAYPDEIFVLRNKPKCVGGTTYCEELESYPMNYFESVLKRSPYHYDLFGAPTNDSHLSDRFGSEENFLCTYRKQTIFPKAALNINKEWKYIYNFKNYIQGVQVEICYGRNTCQFLTDLPMHIRTQCKQRYIQRRLLCSNEEGRPIVDYFMLPSSCACSYTMDYGFLFRKRQHTEKSLHSKSPPDHKAAKKLIGTIGQGL